MPKAHPTFTTRHYEALAETLKVARLKLLHDVDGDYTLLVVATTLADMFRQDNPHFDTDKFIKRIGL